MMKKKKKKKNKRKTRRMAMNTINVYFNSMDIKTL